MTKNYKKKTQEQIERHRIVRLKRRHSDHEYRLRVNRQAKERYQKKRLPIILNELKVNGIKTDGDNFEVLDKKWREFKSQESQIKKKERYERNLKSLRERYKTDEQYRNTQLKKADKQYDERNKFVGTLVNENERLKRKIKEIEHGTN